jgi:hypothetical protein
MSRGYQVTRLVLQIYKKVHLSNGPSVLEAVASADCLLQLLAPAEHPRTVALQTAIASQQRQYCSTLVYLSEHANNINVVRA